MRQKKELAFARRMLAVVLTILMCITAIPSAAFAAADTEPADDWHLQRFGQDTDQTLSGDFLSPAEQGSGFTLEYGKMSDQEGFGSVIVYNAAADVLADSIWEFKMKVSGIEETSNRYQIGIFPRFVNGKNCDGIAIDTSSAIQHSYQVNGSEGWPGISNQTGIAFKINQEYSVKMVTLGNTITMYVDGVKTAETTTRSEITEGRYAVRVWGQGSSPYTKKFELYDNHVTELKNSSVNLSEKTIPADEWGKKDVEIPVTLDKGDQVASVKNGDTVLAAGTDYTTESDCIVLSKDYVAAQEGSFRLEIAFVGGMSGSFQVKKYDPEAGVEEYTWEPEDGAEAWTKLSGSGSYTMEEDGLHIKGENKLLAVDAPSMENGEIELTFELKNDNGRVGFLFRADSENGTWQNILQDDNYSYSTWYYKNSTGTRNGFHGDGTFLFSRAGLSDTKLKLRYWGDNNVTMWMDDYMMYEGSVSGLSAAEGAAGISAESVSDFVLKKAVFRSLPDTYLPEDTETDRSITKGDLTVSLAEDFPRVIEYDLNGKKLYGSEFKHNYVTINAVDYAASAKITEQTAETLVYHVDVEKAGVSFDVAFTAKDGNVLDMRIRNIEEKAEKVNSIGFPNQPLLSANSTQPGAKLDATVPTDGRSSYNINGLEEHHYNIADGKIAYDKDVLVTLPFITTDELSASMANNVLLNLKEFRYRAYRKEDGSITVGYENNDFMYRGIDGERMYPDEDLYCQVVLTEDTNEDGTMDWQDGANALKTIIKGKINGGDKMADSFIHVGYNFASGAQQPFLQVADNMKRLSNYIDGFDQILVLKGYANEGHDSGHADYDDINKRAGGAEDMQTCAESIEEINSILGIHINHSEAYPEAKMYTDETMSSYNGWAWMDQSKNIRRDVDILNGGMDARLDSMFEKVPGIGFVYVDTYGDDRWAEARLAGNLVTEHGAMLGTENKTDFDRFAAWVHWPGIGDSMHRFVYHTQKDVYNGSSIFRGGYSRSTSFMSWQHNNNISNVVKQFYTEQLPQKYLMNHDVRKWTSSEAIFEGNVRSTSGNKIYKDGNLIADGQLVFIPWFSEDSTTKDPDEAAKIYHWNPNGGETTWTLPQSWQGQTTVKLYQTTQNGKKLVSELPVTDGTVTIHAAANTPYVVYKGNEEVQADTTKWSVGSPIEDTNFNSRDFSIWKKSGEAEMAFNDDGNGVSILTMSGTEAGAVSQTMKGLVPGQKYRAVVYAGAENGKTARITVTTPDGVEYENYVEQIVMSNNYFDNYARGKMVQKMWVDFVQPEGETTAVIALSADACESENGKATFMQTRIVKTAEPDLPKGYAANGTFEYVEQGAYGIFNPERAADGVPHLSETHLPYTSDTISGNWSLKMYGLYGQGNVNVRTNPATMRLLPNTEYYMEFDTLGDGNVYVVSESDSSDQLLGSSFVKGHSSFKFTTGEKTDYIVRIVNGSVLDNFEVYYIDDPTPPTVPENVKAEMTENAAIRVTWDASVDEDSSVTGYNVYRNGEPVANVSGTEYLDKDVTEYTVYTYEITAVNAGRTESEKSLAVKGYYGTEISNLIPVSAEMSGMDTALVVFNRKVDKVSAENAENYHISDGVKVTAAVLGQDQKTVTLTLEGMTADKVVVLTVSGVKDTSSAQNTCLGDTPLTLSLLVRYYKFEEDSTEKAVDFMGKEDGTKTAVTVEENGYSGKAASFAGSSRVQLSSDSLYQAKEWTFSAWIKWNGVSGESQTILGNGVSGVASANGMWFHIRNDGKLWASPWANGSGKDMHSADSIPVGVWTHVAIEYNANQEFVMYINGAEAGRLIWEGFPTNILNKINIGCNINGSNSIIHKFRGCMDDVKIYRAALSGDEILAEAQRNLVPTVIGDRFIADKNSDKDTVVTVDTNGYSLAGVSVDETALDASGYTLEGNTFTLKHETIQTLENGEHSVVLTFTKGDSQETAGFDLVVTESAKAVDKSELFKQISMAEELQEEVYTADSWAAMQSVLKEAKELFERTDAVQEQVDAASQALKHAVGSLKEIWKDNMVRQALEKLHDTWAAEDLSVYTKESADALERALAAAEAVLADGSASRKEMDQAVSDLVAAFGGLEYDVQKLHLETAIEAAEKILDIGKNYEDVEGLTAAVEAGKKVLADETASQEEVDGAACDVLDELFQMAKAADISSLESLIEAAKGLLDGKYTSDSLESLKDSIEAAEAVVADQNREDSAIGEAYANLIDAIIGLKMKGNKAALEAMLFKAGKVLADAEAYVAETIQGLAEVTAEAQKVYDNEDALQSEVNEAVKALTLKVAEARLLGDVDGDGAITTADSAAVLRSAAELDTLSAEAALSADVNGDGKADTSDAVLILQYAAEEITAF